MPAPVPAPARLPGPLVRPTIEALRDTLSRRHSVSLVFVEGQPAYAPKAGATTDTFRLCAALESLLKQSAAPTAELGAEA